MQYTKSIGAEKSDLSFVFNQNGTEYTISPDRMFRNTPGDNIDKSALFTTENRDTFYREMTYPGDTTKTMEDCNKQMDNKIQHSFMNVKDNNMINMQNNIAEGMNLDTIKKQQEISHYSIGDISFQLGINDLLKEPGFGQEMKANATIMAYLNKNAYHYTGNDGKEYQAITMSDRKSKYLTDVQELFYVQNGIEYRKDEENNLIFKSNGKEYKWEYDFKPLLSVESNETLGNQKLIDVATENKVDISSLEEFTKEQTEGIISLSERIPSSSKEISQMMNEVKQGESRTNQLDFSDNNKMEKQSFLLEGRKQNQDPEKYNEYLESKNGQKDFFKEDNNELLKEYKEKVNFTANQISSSCKTDEDRILTAMEYLRLNGRYENSIGGQNFEIGSSLSQSGISYALGREGVCSSQAEYLKDILNTMKIPAEVETCNSSGKQNLVRTEDANHAITRIKLNGKSYVLDPTNYDGTKETLAYSKEYTNAPTLQKNRDIEFNLTNQNKEKGEINSELSNAQQTESKKTAIASKIYPATTNLLDRKLKTPFGIKSLKEMNYKTLETDDKSILAARQKAGNMVSKEIGIDKISDFLEIGKTNTDMEKQSLITGYLESHMMPKEEEKIRRRIVKIGDKSLEISDAMELFYIQNDIPYGLENSSLKLDIDKEPVSFNPRNAYKNDLSLEEERNSLFEKQDGSFLNMEGCIGKAVDSITQTEDLNKSFTEKYKVEGIDSQTAVQKSLEEDLKEKSLPKEQEIEDEDPRLDRFLHI